MAKASKQERIVETREIVVQEGGVTLELSLQEASNLRGILGEFEAGDFTSSIFDALGNCGVTSNSGHISHNGHAYKWVPGRGDHDW